MNGFIPISFPVIPLSGFTPYIPEDTAVSGGAYSEDYSEDYS